jgi:hypothetical protein
MSQWSVPRASGASHESAGHHQPEVVRYSGRPELWDGLGGSPDGTAAGLGSGIDASIRRIALRAAGRAPSALCARFGSSRNVVCPHAPFGISLDA